MGMSASQLGTIQSNLMVNLSGSGGPVGIHGWIIGRLPQRLRARDTRPRALFLLLLAGLAAEFGADDLEAGDQ